MQQDKINPRSSPRPGRDPRRKRRRRLRLIRNWVVFLAVCGALVYLMTRCILWVLPKAQALLSGKDPYTAPQYSLADYDYDPEDPRLVLVNNNRPLTSSEAPELETADDLTGQQLQPQAAAAYRAMAEAAAEDGITLMLVTGYQDEAARQEAFEAQKQIYLKQGLSEEEAAAQAAAVVPRPECNELATGLAADILSKDHQKKDAAFEETEAYRWLAAYASSYGFILRWPEERQRATGMLGQPWHWRYVGPENAKAVQASGLSLEEFLALNELA